MRVHLRGDLERALRHLSECLAIDRHARGDARSMTRFETIFFDVGGVCLTNGCDTGARRSAPLHFSLDLEEFAR